MALRECDLVDGTSIWINTRHVSALIPVTDQQTNVVLSNGREYVVVAGVNALSMQVQQDLSWEEGDE